jgi:LEA14-like dessication related protein
MHSDCSVIKKLFVTQLVSPDDETQSTDLSPWQVVDRIANVLQIRQKYGNEADSTQEYIYITKNYAETWYPLDVRGYDQVLEISKIPQEKGVSVVVDGETEEMSVYEN